VRGADHMLSEKSQWTQNGTMFVDLDWLLNASSPLSASAERLVILGQCVALGVKNWQFDEGCIIHIMLQQW